MWRVPFTWFNVALVCFLLLCVCFLLWFLFVYMVERER